MISGPVESLDSGFRLAVQRYYSNGYYHDLYLNRDDTNRQDEYTYRAKWAYTPSDRLRIELTAMQVNIDNGYDAYAIDNSRNTESDQPGVDSQHSTGVSVRAHYLASDTVGLTAIATYAKSVIKYSYDGDWGIPRCGRPWPPSIRPRRFRTATARRERSSCALGTESTQGFGWLAGFYGNVLDESLDRFELERLPAPRPACGPRR